MKTITPESAKELINSLGGEIISGEANIKQTRLGDVLEKFPDSNKWRSLELPWEKCGISKSLQEIVAEGWKEVKTPLVNLDGSTCTQQFIKVLKPEVEALLQFIKSLNLK